jgi:hypothetical protein
MIIRLSQKMATKLKAGSLQEMPLDENPFADWSAHLFQIQRTQYILLCNTLSMYCTLFFGKGNSNDNAFIKTAMASLRTQLEHDRLASVFQRFIAPASGTVRYAKALNRSVTGSMTEQIKVVECWCFYGVAMVPFEVANKLNDFLLSYPGAIINDTYARPLEAFRALVTPTETKDTPFPVQGR